MLGLRRLGVEAVWLEYFPATGDTAADRRAMRAFQRQVHSYDLAYCLLYQDPADDAHELDRMQLRGMSRQALRARLKGPTTLLNLSNSIHPPFLLEFERRLFCDLDPTEIFYWMTKLEMGQQSHHEFWTIGLNYGAPACRLPPSPLRWKTFYPLIDVPSIATPPTPVRPKFTTIGQWYWGGAIEVQGEFPELSKRFAFEQYLDLPSRVPGARFELAMNIGADNPDRGRLAERGWNLVDPHRVANTARRYFRYLASATGEFTAIKGVDVAWQTGWLSDRTAAFLAMGRPVITEDTGAGKFLPTESGVFFVRDLDSAVEAAKEALANRPLLAARGRATARDYFDAQKTLRRMLEMAD